MSPKFAVFSLTQQQTQGMGREVEVKLRPWEMPTHAAAHHFTSFQCFRNKIFPIGRPADIPAHSPDSQFLTQT